MQKNPATIKILLKPTNEKKNQKKKKLRLKIKIIKLLVPKVLILEPWLSVLRLDSVDLSVWQTLVDAN